MQEDKVVGGYDHSIVVFRYDGSDSSRSLYEVVLPVSEDGLETIYCSSAIALSKLLVQTALDRPHLFDRPIRGIGLDRQDDLFLGGLRELVGYVRSGKSREEELRSRIGELEARVRDLEPEEGLSVEEINERLGDSAGEDVEDLEVQRDITSYVGDREDYHSEAPSEDVQTGSSGQGSLFGR